MAVQRRIGGSRLRWSAFCAERLRSPIFLYVFTPEKESISNLPEKERAEILDYYLRFLERSPDHVLT